MNSNVVTMVIVTIILAGGGYWYFTSQSGNDAPLTGSGPSLSAEQTEFESLVSQLEPISFNTEIFSDPRFVSLVDLKTPISPEPSGRVDPFAPIQGVEGQ